MKIHKYLKTSELNKRDRENVITLYLEMFFSTESEEIKLIDLKEITNPDPAFFNVECVDELAKVIKLIRKYEVDGIIVDDATEVN